MEGENKGRFTDIGAQRSTLTTEVGAVAGALWQHTGQTMELSRCGRGNAAVPGPGKGEGELHWILPKVTVALS